MRCLAWALSQALPPLLYPPACTWCKAPGEYCEELLFCCIWLNLRNFAFLAVINVTFLCLTSPSGSCNRSGRCSYFKKVQSVEQTGMDKGLKWYCLFYFYIDLFYKCCLILLPVAVLASWKGCIYSSSIASKGSRKIVHFKCKVQCRQLQFIISGECFLYVVIFFLRIVMVVLGGSYGILKYPALSFALFFYRCFMALLSSSAYLRTCS